MSDTSASRKRKNANDSTQASPDINRFAVMSPLANDRDLSISPPPEKLRRTPIKIEESSEISNPKKMGFYENNIQKLMNSYPRQIYSISSPGPIRSKTAPKLVNYNLSYFVGSCSSCIFVESHPEISERLIGTVVEQGVQIELPWYGASEVIFSDFGSKEAAIKAAQKYAKDQGIPYGRRENDIVSFEIPDSPIEDASDGHSSSNAATILLNEIRSLKNEIKNNSETIQKEMYEMREDFADKLDDLRDAMLQCIQIVQAGNNKNRGGRPNLRPLISTPQWTFGFDETEARIMKTRFGKEFESAFYNRFFKETETILKKLPPKKEMEYRNIITFLSGAITHSEIHKVSVRLNDIIRKKNHSVMNKISRGSTPANAMLENSSTVPLIERDGILVPENDSIPFTRYEDDAIKRYPILLKNGQECDTMFAERRADNIRRWDYFVISADGLRTDAFYNYY